MGKKDLMNLETGQIYSDVVKIRTEEQNKNYKRYMDEQFPKIKTLAPFVRLSGGDQSKEMIMKLTDKSKSRLLLMVLSLDAFGRLKYGGNYEQYCKSFNDICKISGIGEMSESTLKRFKSELISCDILREVKTKERTGVVLNPLIAVNGVHLSPIMWLAYKTTLLENNLINESEALRMDNIMGEEGIIF